MKDSVARRFIWFIAILVMYSVVFYGLAQKWTSVPFISKFVASSPWTYFDIVDFGLLLLFFGGAWFMAGGVKSKRRFQK